MNPIHEIIIKAQPVRISGDSYTGYCPLHSDNPYLSFRPGHKKVNIFCHRCHYIEKTTDWILQAWRLRPENLYVSREMNPGEAEIILCRSNLITLALKAKNFHDHLQDGLMTDEVRNKYKSIISEKLIWFERLEKAMV